MILAFDLPYTLPKKEVAEECFPTLWEPRTIAVKEDSVSVETGLSYPRDPETILNQEPVEIQPCSVCEECNFSDIAEKHQVHNVPEVCILFSLSL